MASIPLFSQPLFVIELNAETFVDVPVFKQVHFALQQRPIVAAVGRPLEASWILISVDGIAGVAKGHVLAGWPRCMGVAQITSAAEKPRRRSCANFRRYVRQRAWKQLRT